MIKVHELHNKEWMFWSTLSSASTFMSLYMIIKSKCVMCIPFVIKYSLVYHVLPAVFWCYRPTLNLFTEVFFSIMWRFFYNACVCGQIGMRQQYMLGRFLRDRYKGFLNESYERQEVGATGSASYQCLAQRGGPFAMLVFFWAQGGAEIPGGV